MYEKLLIFIIIASISKQICGVSYYPCSKQTLQKGEAVQIINFLFDEEAKENQFELNKTGLESILLRPEIADKELAIVNIAGPLRSGKSFFLNLLLQYLENNGALDHNKVDLKHGFYFRGGSKRATVGMLMWSQPFCVMTNSGKEVAILLIDTQGAFDMQQTFADSSVIFALSFLTSSIQIYNLKNHIHSNNLQNLEVFITYGTQISGENELDSKPFQKLTFLIRDWPYAEEFPYGEKGGEMYLKDMMDLKEDLPESAKRLRTEIKAHFSEINCFLMPSPGDKVVVGQFEASDIDPKFLNKLNEFANIAFNPENIVIKKIAGKSITGRVMVKTIELYMNYFKENTHLRPGTVKEAFCKVYNSISFSDVKTFYNNEMIGKCSDQLESSDSEELREYFSDVRNQTIEMFMKIRKSSCEASHEQYLKSLIDFIDKQFEDCYSANQEKKIKELSILLNDMRSKLNNVEKKLINTEEKFDNTEQNNAILSLKLNYANQRIEQLERKAIICDNEIQNMQNLSNNQLIKIEEAVYKQNSCIRLLNKSEIFVDNLRESTKNLTEKLSQTKHSLVEKTLMFESTNEKLNNAIKIMKYFEEKSNNCNKEHQKTLSDSQNKIGKLENKVEKCDEEHKNTRHSLANKISQLSSRTNELSRIKRSEEIARSEVSQWRRDYYSCNDDRNEKLRKISCIKDYRHFQNYEQYHQFAPFFAQNVVAEVQRCINHP